MKEVRIFCDICSAEKIYVGWEQDYHPMTIITQTSSQNPMGDLCDGAQRNEFKADDVCPDCQKAIAYAFARILAERRGEKTLGQLP